MLTVIDCPFMNNTLAVVALAVNAVPRNMFGAADAVTPVCALNRLIAAAVAIALPDLVEEVAVVSEAVSSVVSAAPTATPLIIMVALSRSPGTAVVEGAPVIPVPFAVPLRVNEVTVAVSDL